MRSHLYMELFSIDQPFTTPPSFFIYHKTTSKSLQNKINIFCNSYFKKKSLHLANPEWVSSNLYHLYIRYKPKKIIKIGVNFTKDYHINEDINLYIEQIFGHNDIHLQKNKLHQCDIIISDCPIIITNPAVKVLYVLNDRIDDTALKNLIQQITFAIFDIQNSPHTN
ncbi:hypothetical protein M222_2853 [Enterococcus faecalis AZ19]|nr:hypothetical protein M222_2853 [Enterococcus faecalis AZ19]